MPYTNFYIACATSHIHILLLRSISQRMFPSLRISGLFHNRLNFYGEGLFMPQAGGPLFVGSSQLLICVHSYPPLLEAVSSICNPRMHHVKVTRGQPHFTPRNIFCYSFLLEAEQTPVHGLAGRTRQMEKNSMTSSGSLPASFFIVVQHLSHLHDF
jgi:hypothetical protein